MRGMSDSKIIKGVALMQIGEARGHTMPVKDPRTGAVNNMPLHVDSEMLTQTMTAALKFPNGVKVLTSHEGKVADTIGRVKNFTIEGETLRGDFELNPKHPDFESISWAAENVPDGLGFSARFNNANPKLGNGVAYLRLDKLHSFDLEPETAATPNGLLAAVDNDESTMKAEEISKLITDGITAALPGAVAALKEEIKTELAAAKAANETALAAKANAAALDTIGANIKSELSTELAAQIKTIALAEIKTLCATMGVPSSQVPPPNAGTGVKLGDAEKFESIVAREMQTKLAAGETVSKSQVISLCVAKYPEAHEDYKQRSTAKNPIKL